MEVRVKEKTSGCAVVILGLIILAAIGSIQKACSGGGTKSTSTSTSVDVSLNASLGLGPGGLIFIGNQESVDWTNCTAELNDRYVLHIKSVIPPGKKFVAPVEDFVDSGGERFNDQLKKPQNISVSCDTQTGRRSHYGGWN